MRKTTRKHCVVDEHNCTTYHVSQNGTIQGRHGGKLDLGETVNADQSTRGRIVVVVFGQPDFAKVGQHRGLEQMLVRLECPHGEALEGLVDVFAILNVVLVHDAGNHVLIGKVRQGPTDVTGGIT